MDDKPRSHALAGLLASFVAGAIVGGVGVYVASDYRKATQHLLEEICSIQPMARSLSIPSRRSATFTARLKNCPKGDRSTRSRRSPTG